MVNHNGADETETELETQIKIRWTGDARSKLNSRGIIPPLEDGVEWAKHARKADNRQKTQVVLKTREEVEAYLKALQRMLYREPRTCTWMTGGHKRAFKRVWGDLIDALTERGVDVDHSGRGAPSLNWEPEPEDVDAEAWSESMEDESTDPLAEAREEDEVTLTYRREDGSHASRHGTLSHVQRVPAQRSTGRFTYHVVVHVSKHASITVTHDGRVTVKDGLRVLEEGDAESLRFEEHTGATDAEVREALAEAGL